MTASHFTPRLSLPYPDEADPADVPLDIHNLATALDTVTARTPGQAATAVPVLDVGVAGQIRAGRQLTLADFTALGLSAPAGLWNLSDLNDASGSNRLLVNKGAVPFGPGINGLSTTCAVFAGSTGQSLYVADIGAGDPFRLANGSWGCWFRTAKRGIAQALIGKWGASAAAWGYLLYIDTTNVVIFGMGDATSTKALTAVSDVADDRWHCAVATHDGAVTRVYIDGVLEASGAVLGGSGVINASPSALNIGSNTADAATAAANPHYGRVDEAFVTADVLTPDQVRILYCAKLAHGFAITPTAVTVNVRRRRKGAALAVTDFPTQPLRLHNFTAGALTDQGSGNVPLTNNGGALSAAGADGALGGAFNFVATSAQSLSSTDAGLPAALAARSYGCWFKTATVQTQGVIAWGTQSTADARMTINSNGALTSNSGADVVTGPYVTDGQWHHAVMTEDNAAGDGVRRKMYVDGRLVGGSTVLNTLTLAGVNRFRIAAIPDGTNTLTGQIDGAFVCGYALTQDQVSTLYAKGSSALAPSPKNAGDHVEHMDATNVYATFDTLDSQHQIDLAVTG